MKKYPGFTIVELLIVIVVIGILAAITMVAYSGISERARVASISSALSQASKKLALHMVESGVYPSVLSAVGINDSNDISYQYSTYTSSSPQSFCITATIGSTSYSILADGAPQIGGCPGHGVGGLAALINILPNPSLETNTASWGGPNGATVARDTSKTQTGSASLRVTMPIANSTAVGAYALNSSVAASLKPMTTYSYSVYVFAPSGTTDIILSIQGAGVASTTNGNASASTSVKDSWVRLNCTYTTTASGSVVMYVLNKNSISVAGTQFWIDGAMLTEGSSLNNYADGNSTNWVWTSTVNNSTSTGPAL